MTTAAAKLVLDTTFVMVAENVLVASKPRQELDYLMGINGHALDLKAHWDNRTLSHSIWNDLQSHGLKEMVSKNVCESWWIDWDKEYKFAIA